MNKHDKALEYINKAIELDPIYKKALELKEEVLKSI